MAGAPKYGVQVKTVDACKICQSPHRAEIEDTYVIGRRGELLDNGIKPTGKWILENAERLWGMPLNTSNLYGHCKKHFVEGNPAELEAAARDLPTAIKEMLDGAGLPSIQPEHYLELIVAIGYQKALLDPGSISTDQVLKAIGELTKRKHNEVQDKLMEELVGATGAALRRIGPPAQPQLSDPVIEVPAEDVEVVRDPPS